MSAFYLKYVFMLASTILPLKQYDFSECACLFVCLFLISFEKTELKVLEDHFLWGADGFRLKYIRIRPLFPGKLAKFSFRKCCLVELLQLLQFCSCAATGKYRLLWELLVPDLYPSWYVITYGKVCMYFLVIFSFLCTQL